MKKNIVNLKRFYLFAVVVIAGCSSEPQPEPIHVGEDLCAACRMAIIEPQFAAEIVQPSGEVLKYDDLACLAKGVANLPNTSQRQVFVQDYFTREWMRHEQVVVVRESRLQTPMGSGAVALASHEAAEKFIAENGGQPMSLQVFLQQSTSK